MWLGITACYSPCSPWAALNWLCCITRRCRKAMGPVCTTPCEYWWSFGAENAASYEPERLVYLALLFAVCFACLLFVLLFPGGWSSETGPVCTLPACFPSYSVTSGISSYICPVSARRHFHLPKQTHDCWQIRVTRLDGGGGQGEAGLRLAGGVGRVWPGRSVGS